MVVNEVSLPELVEEARRLSTLIDRGIAALRDSAKSAAHAEHDYRHAKAEAWQIVGEGLADEKRARVDAMTAELRMARDIAEGERQAALEAIRSRRSQLSALQSILAATRSEIELAR